MNNEFKVNKLFFKPFQMRKVVKLYESAFFFSFCEFAEYPLF